ncbi:hypothetical protein [Phytobacter ursingii]|uniref:hypothetical protein n=1 Tax=Phytobacter ursingii TaxID=1972431 RepID=UPI0012B6E8DB
MTIKKRNGMVTHSFYLEYLFGLLQGLFIFFIIILTFAIAGSYTRRIHVTGEISSHPRATNVYSSVQGVVVKKLVSEGQIISIGTPIYYIDVSKNTLSGVVSENQRKDINNQLIRISQIINRLENNRENTLRRNEYATLDKKAPQPRGNAHRH